MREKLPRGVHIKLINWEWDRLTKKGERWKDQKRVTEHQQRKKKNPLKQSNPTQTHILIKWVNLMQFRERFVFKCEKHTTNCHVKGYFLRSIVLLKCQLNRKSGHVAASICCKAWLLCTFCVSFFLSLSISHKHILHFRSCFRDAINICNWIWLTCIRLKCVSPWLWGKLSWQFNRRGKRARKRQRVRTTKLHFLCAFISIHELDIDFAIQLVLLKYLRWRQRRQSPQSFYSIAKAKRAMNGTMTMQK